jgi:hypothetical protein
MSEDSGLAMAAVARDRRQVMSDLVALTKPRVVLMALSARGAVFASIIYLPLLLGLLAIDKT